MELIDKKINEELNIPLEQSPYEMSTVQLKRSKLIYNAWLDYLGNKRDMQHIS